MTKLLTALLIGSLSLSAYAAPFTNDEVFELCKVVTTDPILRAEVKVYVTAIKSGMSDDKAEQFAYRFSNRQHRGSTFGLKNPVFSGYINELGDTKDFNEAMGFIQRKCEKHLRSL